MKLFGDLGIEYVMHYSPLHYFPFIGRSRCLKSKPALEEEGFTEAHFRSKSRHHDQARGFGSYAFLTLSQSPRIVAAKLRGGFPHVGVNVPIHAFENVPFDLCRYNVAMSRRLPTSPQGGHPESDTNGRYYDGMALPIARTFQEKQQMLEKHYKTGTMIEVLVQNQLQLPDDTYITCFSHSDYDVINRLSNQLEIDWEIRLLDPPGQYPHTEHYAQAADNFIECALRDPLWRGNGLEFDKV